MCLAAEGPIQIRLYKHSNEKGKKPFRRIRYCSQTAPLRRGSTTFIRAMSLNWHFIRLSFDISIGAVERPGAIAGKRRFRRTLSRHSETSPFLSAMASNRKLVVKFKRIALAAGGLVIVGIAVAFWLKKPQAKAEEAPQNEIKIERGSLRSTVNCTGRVVAALDVDIKCKASGQIITLPFDVSDPVEEGDLLLELDPVDEARAVRQAGVETSASLARLAQAQTNYEIAERNVATERQRALAALESAEVRSRDASAKAKRIEDLLAKKLSSQEEYDTARTSAIQALADLESAKARIEDLKTKGIELNNRKQDVALAEASLEADYIALDNARQRLRDTKVYSPVNGVVATRSVQIGQIISSGISNVGGGTTVMVISDLSSMFIYASVDESDIGKIQVGQRALISCDAYPNMKFFGEVVRIATRGANVSNVVTFEVRIEVGERGLEYLKPEMTANVEIVVGEAEDVVLAPSDAVVRRKGRQVVNVKKPDGTFEEREVKVGISDGVNTEIQEGLKEGDIVRVQSGEQDSRWRGPGGERGGDRGMSGARQMRMMMPRPPGGGGSRGR